MIRDGDQLEMDVLSADLGVGSNRARIVRFRIPEMQFQVTIEPKAGRSIIDQMRDEAIKAQLKMIQLVADAKMRGLE